MESLFGVPQDSNSGFNFIVLSRNFKNFVSCIEPIVSVHKAIENIYNWKSPSWSLLACFGLYILFKTNGFWIVVPGLWLWMIYSPTCSRKAESSIDTYKQNLYYIQEFMGAASIRLQKYKQWKQDVLYWGNPSSAKKFKRKLELIVIPIVIFSYIFTIGDVIMAVLILSIILKNPLIQLSILLIFFQSKNKITTVLATNTEKKYYRIYENQRLWFGVWKSFTLPAERGNWSDINGRNIEKDSIVLEEGWEWERDWEIDSENNSEGWEYSTDFTKSFHPKKEFWDYVRRRCWKRACVCI
jgi:Integral peroxisomal membrane peroxin